MNFSLIAAADSRLGIGKRRRIPWHLPSDMKFFHKKTVGLGRNAVIMGRVTWETIPGKHRPLPRRLNIVVSRQPDYVLPPGVKKAALLDEALALAEANNAHEIFVIGGSRIYAEAVAHPKCQTMYLTHIEGEFDCDVFFPHIDTTIFHPTEISPTHEENGVKFRFVTYERS